jgi:hypothetical protein
MIIERLDPTGIVVENHIVPSRNYDRFLITHGDHTYMLTP